MVVVVIEKDCGCWLLAMVFAMTMNENDMMMVYGLCFRFSVKVHSFCFHRIFFNVKFSYFCF